MKRKKIISKAFKLEAVVLKLNWKVQINLNGKVITGPVCQTSIKWGSHTVGLEGKGVHLKVPN